MLLASVILACSCLPDAPRLLAPANDATDVSVAAQVAVLTVTGQRPLLVGDGINVTEETLPDPFDADLAITLLKPSRDLTPNTTYQVVLSGGSLSVGQFTTAASASPAPVPVAPSEVVVYAERLPAASSSCDSGGPDRVGLRISHTGAENAAWYEVVVAINGAPSDPAVWGSDRAIVFSTEACYRRGPVFAIGDEVCATVSVRGIDGSRAEATPACAIAKACPSGAPCLSLPDWPNDANDGCRIAAVGARDSGRGTLLALAVFALALLVRVAKVGAKRRALQR